MQWLRQLLCRHSPKKVMVKGGYCTFGVAYWIKCEKCGKTLGTHIDKF